MKQLTDLEKKVRRRIAKASKRGRYLTVTRRGRRDRPGRKKGSKKRELLEGIQFKSFPEALKPFKLMNIPKMTEK